VGIVGSDSVVGTTDFDFVGNADLGFVGIVYSGFVARTVYLGSAAGTGFDSGLTDGIEGSVGIANSDSVDDAAADLERSSVESVVVVEVEQDGHSVAQHLDLIQTDHVSEKEQDVVKEYDVVDGQGVETVAGVGLEYDVLQSQTHSDFQPRFVYSELEDY
jgi:hypothetical protein